MTYQIFDNGIGYFDIMFVYGTNTFQMSIGSGFCFVGLITYVKVDCVETGLLV